MKKDIYDKIAEKYKRIIIKPNPERKYVFAPTLFNILGNLNNKKVLELACGEGYFSRLIKQKGALQVMGVDVSKEMIKLARMQEKQNPLGIKYFVYDALNLPKLDEFDIVIGTLLLHYSKTKTELLRMCKNIYKNIKYGGKFIGLNSNPNNPLSLDKKYGSMVIAKKPLKEGDALKVTLFDGDKKVCSFINYYWKKKTYNEAFKKAGFKKIKWQQPIVSKEGIEKYGKDFWRYYFKRPSIIGVEYIK